MKSSKSEFHHTTYEYNVSFTEEERNLLISLLKDDLKKSNSLIKGELLNKLLI